MDELDRMLARLPAGLTRAQPNEPYADEVWVCASCGQAQTPVATDGIMINVPDGVLPTDSAWFVAAAAAEDRQVQRGFVSSGWCLDCCRGFLTTTPALKKRWIPIPGREYMNRFGEGYFMCMHGGISPYLSERVRGQCQYKATHQDGTSYFCSGHAPKSARPNSSPAEPQSASASPER